MDNYYNIALLPTDQPIGDLFIRQASIFLSNADGYCLGQNAEPHMTLCQFEGEDQDLEDLWRNISMLTIPTSVKTGVFNIRTGTGIHEGYNWIENTLPKDPVLIDTQRAIYNLIRQTPYKPTTNPDLYSPHFTYCRILARKFTDDIFRDFSLPEIISVKIALGQSTKNGEWQLRGLGACHLQGT